MTSPSPKPRRRTKAAPPVEIEAAPVADLPAGGPMSVERGAVGRADATSLEVHQGAIGGTRAESVTVAQGAVGLAVAGEVQVRQGVVGTLVAGSSRVEQSFVRTLVAGEVRLERATGVGVLLARKVVGDVKVVLDWRGALAFGAAAGVVAGLLGRGRNKPGARTAGPADRVTKRADRRAARRGSNGPDA